MSWSIRVPGREWRRYACRAMTRHRSDSRRSRADATGRQAARGALLRALRNGKLLVGLGIVLLFLVTAIIGPILVTATPNDYLGPPMRPPSSEYWFGTTTFGQDVFVQFVYGLRATFWWVCSAAGSPPSSAWSSASSPAIGAAWWTRCCNMFTNIVLVIPTLAVLLIIAAYLARPRRRRRGAVHRPHVLAVGGAGHPRPDVLARIQGVRRPGPAERRAGAVKIIVREIAPNMSSYLFMTFILLFGGPILIARHARLHRARAHRGHVARADDEQRRTWSALHARAVVVVHPARGRHHRHRGLAVRR